MAKTIARYGTPLGKSPIKKTYKQLLIKAPNGKMDKYPYVNDIVTSEICNPSFPKYYLQNMPHLL